ncbi:MAG: quinol monooxygenase YgiN [Gammaproteobacteria bacterium]|jgi:quinol monooxygenase YgiN
MIYSNVLLTVNNEADVNVVHELLVEQARHSHDEPGCHRFEVYHSHADPLFFLLVEQWESQADLDRHKEAQAFIEIYIPKVLPLVRRIPHPSSLIWP